MYPMGNVSLEQVSYKDVFTRTPAGLAQHYLQLRAACVVLCTALRMDVDALMGMAEIPSNSFIHSASNRPQAIPKLSCAASFKDHTRTPPIEITL